MKSIHLKSSNTTSGKLAEYESESGSQGARRATEDPDSGNFIPKLGQAVPDPEVQERTPRRRFSAAYKLRILKQYDDCTKPGEIGALLRREGLYSSNLNAWRRQREQGVLDGLAAKKRGRKPKQKNPLAKDIARLESENKKLTKQLRQAQAIIEVQKKISEILGIAQNNTNEKHS